MAEMDNGSNGEITGRYITFLGVESMAMNERQMIAIASPCTRAMDTIQEKFWRRIKRWSTILTINK